MLLLLFLLLLSLQWWHKQGGIIKIPKGTFFCCCCCFFCSMSIFQGSSCVLIYVMASSMAVNTPQQCNNIEDLYQYTNTGSLFSFIHLSFWCHRSLCNKAMSLLCMWPSAFIILNTLSQQNFIHNIYLFGC